MAKTFKRFALTTIVAGAAGYVAGLLTAPKSGQATRQDIKNTANKTVSEAEKQLKNAHTELNTLVDEAKQRGKDLKGKGKAQLDEAAATAVTAKNKVREMISAVREGEAEDRELQRAMTEASRAIKHLKAYLKK